MNSAVVRQPLKLRSNLTIVLLLLKFTFTRRLTSKHSKISIFVLAPLQPLTKPTNILTSFFISSLNEVNIESTQSE